MSSSAPSMVACSIILFVLLFLLWIRDGYPLLLLCLVYPYFEHSQLSNSSGVVPIVAWFYLEPGYARPPRSPEVGLSPLH